MSRLTIHAAISFLAATFALSASWARAADEQPGGQPPQHTMRARTTSVSGAITEIDHDSRKVTIKGDKGKTQNVTVPPEMTRFDELKVGDRVNLTYHESVALAITPP